MGTLLKLPGVSNKVRSGLLVAAMAFNVAASEVKQARMTFAGKAYQYQFTVDLEASFEAVHAVVTDYDNLDRINTDIVQSEILERYDERRLKRRMWLNHCLLVFCFDLYFVEDVEEFDDGVIKTVVLPAASNFRRGYSNWRIERVSATLTRLSVEAEQEPDFWVPPLIGPIVFKRAFMKEVRETASNIEREARRVELE